MSDGIAVFAEVALHAVLLFQIVADVIAIDNACENESDNKITKLTLLCLIKSYIVWIHIGLHSYNI